MEWRVRMSGSGGSRRDKRKKRNGGDDADGKGEAKGKRGNRRGICDWVCVLRGGNGGEWGVICEGR